MAQVVNDSNFSEVIVNSGKPAIVDFWAPWCGPCRMMSPIVDAMAEKYEGKVTVAKCDVDESSDVPTQYGIRNIPTILFFNEKGEMVDRVVGSVPQNELEAKIENLIK